MQRYDRLWGFCPAGLSGLGGDTKLVLSGDEDHEDLGGPEAYVLYLY